MVEEGGAGLLPAGIIVPSFYRNTVLDTGGELVGVFIFQGDGLSVQGGACQFASRGVAAFEYFGRLGAVMLLCLRAACQELGDVTLVIIAEQEF